MAERYAVATGNWSAVGTWDGGASVPTSGDVVYSNGNIIFMNQSTVTVSQLRNDTKGGTYAADGFYYVDTDDKTINADLYGGNGAFDSYGLVITGKNNTLNGNIECIGDSGAFYASGWGNVVNGNVTAGPTISFAAAIMTGENLFNGNSIGGSTGTGLSLSNGSTQIGNSSCTAPAYGTSVSAFGVQVGTANGLAGGSVAATQVESGGIFYGHAVAGATGSFANGVRVESNGTAILTGVTNETADAVLFAGASIIYLRGAQLADLTLPSNYRIGDALPYALRRPFIRIPTRIAMMG